MKTCPQCNRTYDERVVFCPRDGSSLVVGGRLVAGRYQIIEMIGRGGMGSVYKAVHTGIARVCALKLFTEISGDDEAAVARFSREARNAARIRHPNAVAMYDFGQDEGGTPFLAMEFVEGTALSEVLARERALPMERVLHITRQVADVLSYTHGLGIVHSDLKPHKIMLTRAGADEDFVKVLDLGLARAAVRGDDDATTKAGFVMGTPAYMSPEQASGETLDARSDIYSLGLVVYEMLSGQLPFKGNTPLEMVIKRLSDDPVRLSEVAPSVSQDVERAVMNALARDRESRPPSAKAFADQLLVERRPPPTQRTTVGSAPAPPQSAPTYPDRPTAMPMPKSPMRPSEPERVTRPQPVGSPGPKSGMWEKITGMLGRRKGATGEIKAAPPPAAPPPVEPPRPTMESSEPEGVACPTCHTMNEAGWAFCQQCGSKLPQSANQPPVEPPRPMDPQTVVAQPVRDMGPGLGQPIEPPPQEPPYVMGQQTVPNQPVAPPRPAPPPPEPPPPQLGRPTVVSQPSPPREPNIPLGQPTVMDQPATQPPPQQRFNPPQGMSTESVQSMPSKGMGGVPCQQCGHLNNMGSAFCAACGTPIPVAKTIVMSSVAAAPKGRLHLIMEGGQQGEVYDLKDDTMIGRVGGEITFPHDGFMSGRHARIVRKGNSFVLTDEGSRNGTFIKIKDEVELKPGDMILIGKQLFKFEV